MYWLANNINIVGSSIIVGLDCRIGLLTCCLSLVSRDNSVYTQQLIKSGLAAINEYIRKENAVQIFDASWNSLCSKGNQLAFKTTFQLLDVQQKLQSPNDTQQEIWYLNKITESKYVKEFMQNSLNDVQHVNVAGAVMTECQMLIFCDCLMTNNNTLTELDLSGNEITDEEVKKLAVAIQINKTLQELNISKNWISKEGVMRVVEAYAKNSTLHKLVCTHNNLGD